MKNMFLKFRKIHRKTLISNVIEEKTEKTSAQVFLSAFCEIFNNAYFVEHLWSVASGLWQFN